MWSRIRKILRSVQVIPYVDWGCTGDPVIDNPTHVTIKMPLTEFMSRLGLDKRPVEVFVDWSNGGTVEIPLEKDTK